MNKGKYLNDILTSYESDDIISNKLIDLRIDSIGSKEFIAQHAYINKLNMQVIKNILTGGEDPIMQQFVDKEKLKPLIKELFTINCFKTFVYPTIKPQIAQLSSIKSYLILYHEACVINLIENFLYNVTACIAADDFIVDVIEYCYNMITKYINEPSKKAQTPEAHANTSKASLQEEMKKLEAKLKEPPEEELNEKQGEIAFSIAMCSINILRYVSDHLKQLPFPVCHHMMNAKDIPLLCVALMESKPWLKKTVDDKKEECEEIYENNQWVKRNANAIPKLEAQVWITLYNLLMNPEMNKKYEITEYRQNRLVRLRKYFSTTLYDLIPNMTDLYRSIEQMALMTYGNTLTVNPFIIEMVPQLTKAFKLSGEQIKAIGEKVVKEYFQISKEAMREELAPINDVYNVDNIEYFMDDPKCAQCGKDATNRCSRCKSEWYCGKECQVKRWKQHKEICKTLADLNKEAEIKKQHKEVNQTPPSKQKELVTEIIKESIPKPPETATSTQEQAKALDELD